jgi:tripartite-type tricarboxylate transporter receptor subunit TctC
MKPSAQISKLAALKLTALAILSVLSVSSGARCDPVAAFFAGKQISLFIGTTAGGGYDLYARTLARHMGRHIPGHPSFIPKNMPGAGGLALANYLYNRAPNDGSELATVQNGLPFEKLFQTLSPEGRNALFDAAQFGWIGSMAQTVFVTVTWYTSSVKTLEDARMKAAVLGASATSSDSYVLAMMSNNLLGTRFSVVHGYAGAAELDLAVEKGELEGEAGKDWTTLVSTRPQRIRERKINVLLQMGIKAHPDLKDVPMAIDLASTEEDLRIMEVVFAKFGMSRPFLAPPGISPERLAMLRRAFDATMNDPAFRVEAQKLGMEVNPVSGEDVQRLVIRIMGTGAELAARTRAMLRPQ